MRLRIVSYNVHKAVGTDGRRDAARILAVLNAIDPDVAVLQEADMRLGARPSALPRFLIAQETDLVPLPLARTDVSLGWHGNAILLRRGLEPARLAHIDLPGLEPRGAVMAEIGGIAVVGTHLGLLRHWRNRQMQRILTALGAGAARAVVAGDFNEWSSRAGFEPWEHDFAVLRPGASFHARRPVGRLDGFALGRDMQVRSAGVFTGARARTASDHLPVWSEVEAGAAR